MFLLILHKNNTQKNIQNKRGYFYKKTIFKRKKNGLFYKI